MKERDINHIHGLMRCRDEAERLLTKIQPGSDPLYISGERGPLSPTMLSVRSETFRDFLEWQRHKMQCELDLLGIRGNA